MTLKHIATEELVKLWYTTRPAREIATELGVSEPWLLIQWRLLRRENKLPKANRRVIARNQHDPSRDRLLERLRAVHGGCGDDNAVRSG